LSIFAMCLLMSLCNLSILDTMLKIEFLNWIALLGAKQVNLKCNIHLNSHDTALMYINFKNWPRCLKL